MNKKFNNNKANVKNLLASINKSFCRVYDIKRLIKRSKLNLNHEDRPYDVSLTRMKNNSVQSSVYYSPTR